MIFIKSMDDAANMHQWMTPIKNVTYTISSIAFACTPDLTSSYKGALVTATLHVLFCSKDSLISLATSCLLFRA